MTVEAFVPSVNHSIENGIEEIRVQVAVILNDGFLIFKTSSKMATCQQDNATTHASRVATKWLQEHSSDFRHFHWPPKSPEMNIIVDIRDALLHAVEKRSPPPRTPMNLLTALQDSWCEFPPGYLQTPVECMPRRFSSLLRARGGPTRY
ncbi:hypothetical protein AVEN_39370-1 [Araneus ventricosus]|uniref:Tc1-like transposase DDE domain-containing protein n=1 Tax=Araneus ventricosus TaxID=182803 RepID=A0A4Y2SW57_ARAVE|nr:hypothetical protein AVEN_39370-1 [Araneus ventricosus]